LSPFAFPVGDYGQKSPFGTELLPNVLGRALLYSQPERFVNAVCRIFLHSRQHMGI
jgi:hypothetical protein